MTIAFAYRGNQWAITNDRKPVALGTRKDLGLTQLDRNRDYSRAELALSDDQGRVALRNPTTFARAYMQWSNGEISRAQYDAALAAIQ